MNPPSSTPPRLGTHLWVMAKLVMEFFLSSAQYNEAKNTTHVIVDWTLLPLTMTYLEQCDM